MKILVHENVLTIKTEAGDIQDIIRNISYTIEPDSGKVLKNKITGVTTKSLIGLSSNESINNYEEISEV